MVRSTQLLHPARQPVAARAAATVLLLRDSSAGVEVLMTRRSMSASFAPGAYVFPGGAVDAADAASHGQARRRERQSDTHLTEAIAAIRESFEELGVLLARRSDGAHADQRDIAALDRGAPFALQCAAMGLTLAADEVFMLARWITDRDLPRRFDVPFLVARMPAGQTPVADESEQFEPVWIRPVDALARHSAGGFCIIFPTIRTLQRLLDYSSFPPSARCKGCSTMQACRRCFTPAPPPSNRCGPVARARACWPVAKHATWSTNSPMASWRWCVRRARSSMRWTGNVSAPWRC